MTSVEIAVVGRGIIGSAAARHLVESGRSVALIGPDEPTDRQASQGPFCSHPDEGRITRIAGRGEVWTEVAAHAVARYADIEARSGIEFHHPRGVVVGFEDADDWVERGQRFGSDARRVDRDWVRDTTGIHIGTDIPLLAEGPPAGWINPRRMVAAQTELVASGGGQVIRDAVTALRPAAAGIEIEGPFGTVTARQVLLATGAFGSELIGQTLDVERRPRTVLMAETADDPRIPSLILQGPPDDRLNEIYWNPPLRYPDGRLRLKIGGDLKRFDPLEAGELVPWFQSQGSDVEIEALTNSLRSLLPDTEFGHLDRSPCVVTATPTRLPYIGWLDQDIAVAIAGNGSAAKSGDELGRLAASLFGESGWDSSLDRELFQPRVRF